MKPKTKKTMIIVAAVIAIAVIVYFVFIQKKWERILNNLDIDKAVKQEIRTEARRIEASAELRKKVEAEAADVGETYDRWLIMTAAMNLQYPVQTNYFGQIIINPKD